MPSREMAATPIKKVTLYLPTHNDKVINQGPNWHHPKVAKLSPLKRMANEVPLLVITKATCMPPRTVMFTKSRMTAGMNIVAAISTGRKFNHKDPALLTRSALRIRIGLAVHNN